MQIAKRNACKMTVKSLNIRKLNDHFEFKTRVDYFVQGVCHDDKDNCYASTALEYSKQEKTQEKTIFLQYL